MKRLVAILLLLATPLFAEELQINVETRLEPAEAIGLLVSSKGTKQVTGVRTERLADNLLVAHVPLPGSVAPDTAVTVMVVDAKGQTAFGNVRPANGIRDSFYSIPVCPPERVSASRLQNHVSVLEQLVDVRAQRRSVAQVQVTQALSGDFLARLRSLETSFGLPQDPVLAPDMRPVELIDRLSRLLAAIHTLEAHNRPSK